jgi:hypothetical protein
MNASYAKTLAASLPAGLVEARDEATMNSLGDPKVLLSQPAMAALEENFRKAGREALFPQTVRAIRTSMEAGLRSVFWVSAITMLLAFLIISTVPQVSWETETRDKKGS